MTTYLLLGFGAGVITTAAGIGLLLMYLLRKVTK